MKITQRWTSTLSHTVLPPVGDDIAVRPCHIRNAIRLDVPALVALLRDDTLGRGREAAPDERLDRYYSAFDDIEADPNNELIVADDGDVAIGVLQITYAPGLSRQGAWRATLEGIRVSALARGRGIGRRLFTVAEARARARGCQLMQLTTDASRVDAMRFYASLGFKRTHIGFKRSL